MLKNNCLFVLFILISVCVSAQKYNITGTISDDNNETLINASVILLNKADSILVTFALTNNNGKFQLERVPKGEFLLQATYLGYESYEQNITVSDENMDLGDIKMNISSSRLDEIVVQDEHIPVSVKKDTIVYNADAFATQPNDVVEDLLRRMPGIEVDQDGTITAQGEEVEQVLVDGKEFFGSDPKIATKNLPASAVDKVEVFDQKSDQAEFSGIDDGERTKTMNLELKEDAKKGSFGLAGIGYGTEDRYAGNLSINSFKKDLKVSLIGNFNNVNQQGFSVDNYISFMGGIGGAFGGGRNSSIPISRGLSDGFVTTNAGGINLSYDFAPKTDMTISYFINDIDNVIDRFSTTENFFQAGNLFTEDGSNQNSGSTNHNVNLRFETELDSSQDIRIRSTLSLNNGNVNSTGFSELATEAGDIRNEGTNAFISNANDLGISANATYRKKMGKKAVKILTINGRINDTGSETTADQNSENIFFPNDPARRYSELIVQRQLQNSDRLNYSVNTTFTYPLKKGKYLELKYSHSNQDNDLVREVYDAIDNGEILNRDLSQDYRTKYNYNNAGFGFHRNGEKSSFSAVLNLQSTLLTGDERFNDFQVDRNFLNLLPRINWRYELGQAHNINVRYSTNINEPSLTQLQPTVDNTNPLNIYQGNPALKPEYSHRINTRYFKYDQFSFTSFFAFINATYTSNKILNSVTLTDDFRQITTPVNVDSDFNLTGSVNFGTPLKFIGAKLDLSTRMTFVNRDQFINSVKNKLNRYTNNFTARIGNRKKDKIDIEVGGTLRYNNNRFSVNTDQNNNYLDQSYFSTFIANLGERFAFETSMNYDIYSAQTFGESLTIPIWKAEVSHFFLNNKKGELKLAVFDILNRNTGLNRTNNLNFIEQERILSLGRYFMLSFTYSIKGFGNKENQGGGRGGRRFRG